MQQSTTSQVKFLADVTVGRCVITHSLWARNEDEARNTARLQARQQWAETGAPCILVRVRREAVISQ